MKQIEQMEQSGEDNEPTLLGKAFKGIWRISDILLLVSLPLLLAGLGLGVMALLGAAPFPPLLWGVFAALTFTASLLLSFRCGIRFLAIASTGALSSKGFTLVDGYAVTCIVFLAIMIVFGSTAMAANAWGVAAFLVIFGSGLVAFFESQLAQQGATRSANDE